jgi:hypothetical protein
MHGKAVLRRASNGNPYVTCKVRAATRAGEAYFVNVLCFNDVATLQALDDGDAVALAGELSVEVYTPQSGNPRPNLSLLAHGCLSAYSVHRKRKAVREEIPGRLDFRDVASG